MNVSPRMIRKPSLKTSNTLEEQKVKRGISILPCTNVLNTVVNYTKSLLLHWGNGLKCIQNLGYICFLAPLQLGLHIYDINQVV